MNNKVLLVYPGGFNSLFPELPLPLLYLSWALMQKDFSVEILDTRIRQYSDMKNFDYLFVGISTMTGSMIGEGLKVAKHVRRFNKEVPLVWGGIHPTLLPQQTIENEFVDIVVRGEGEITIQDLALALQNQGSLSELKGISYKQGDRVISNPDRKPMNLNEIDKELPYDLFEMDKYNLPAFPVHTSRGCPYRCGFCYNTAFNKRIWRFKTSERVLDEIEYVVSKLGVRKISFTWEDEFFIRPSRVKEICNGIIERGIKIEWESFCRFDSFQKVDDELLRLMEESGCVSLSFGGESGSKRILDEVIHKDITVGQIVKTTEVLSRTNIRQIISFMSGLPTETDEDMNMTFNLIDKLTKINPKNIYFNGIFLYTPYPGTILFDEIVKNYNYEIPGSFEEWSKFGIYRNVKTKWHKSEYIKKYKTISIMTRFPFWKAKLSLKDVSSVIGGSRFGKFPFNIAYWLLTNMSILRWKKKYFKYPIEWILTEKALEKMRGFV